MRTVLVRPSCRSIQSPVTGLGGQPRSVLCPVHWKEVHVLYPAHRAGQDKRFDEPGLAKFFERNDLSCLLLLPDAAGQDPPPRSITTAWIRDNGATECFSFHELKEGGRYLMVPREPPKSFTVHGLSESGPRDVTLAYSTRRDALKELLTPYGVGSLIGLYGCRDAFTFEDIVDGGKYQADAMRSIERQVSELGSWNRNQIAAYDEAGSKTMETEAKRRFPGSNVKRIASQTFLKKKRKLCEVDAAVIIHHPDGKVEAWLGEHKSVATPQGATKLRILRKSLGEALKLQESDAPEVHEVFGAVDDMSQAKLWLMGNTVRPVEGATKEDTLSDLKQLVDAVLEFSGEKFVEL